MKTKRIVEKVAENVIYTAQKVAEKEQVMKIENGTGCRLYTFNECELNQHDLEIRAYERKKVREELEEWVKKYQFFIGDCVCIADTQENIYLGEAIDKLAKYKNTGLEPSEVEQLKKENEELKSAQNKVAIEKLEELYKCFNEMNQNTEYESFVMNRKFALHKIDTMITELKGGKNEK